MTDPEDLAETLTTAKARDTTIVLTCNCEVQYDGRARSELGGGDRLVILKPDGTVLVHGPEKRNPRNWMTPGASYSIRSRDGELVIEAEQESKEGVEHLDIWVTEVYDYLTQRLLDGREKDLTGTEDDLQERLFKNGDLIEDGFRPEEREWETDAGPVDIYGYDSDGNVCLVEVKRRQIDPEAVHQLRRYLEVGFEAEYEVSDIRGFLVAPDISEQAQDLADEYGFTFVSQDPRRSSSRKASSLDQFQ